MKGRNSRGPRGLQIQLFPETLTHRALARYWRECGEAWPLIGPPPPSEAERRRQRRRRPPGDHHPEGRR